MNASKEAGFFEKTSLFFNQVKTEMSKVSWPTKEECKLYAIVVIVSTIIVSIIIGVWDLLLGIALQFIIGLGGGA